MSEWNDFIFSSRPFVVFDLEVTAWEGSLAAGWNRPGELKEIVQIGAVLLESDLSEAAAFSQYVRPQRNPILSSYFINLTGIDQQTVDSCGVNCKAALELFGQFIGTGSPIVSNGPDGDVILENCALYGFVCPIDPGLFRDIRREIARALSVPETKADSYCLPRLAGLPIQVQAHDALSDARSVAAVLRALEKKSRPRCG